MPRRLFATTLTTLTALLVAACGGLLPLSSSTDSNQFDEAPVAVRQRISLPSCGGETAGHVDGFNVEGRECLWSAYKEGRPAEFVSTLSTIEGDPITLIYRVLPDGSVEVFLDSTKDKWSAMTWLHLACPGLSLIEGAPRQPAFGPGLGDQPGGECRETTLR